MNTPSINTQLARFVNGLRFSDIPAKVVERAKVLVLDTLATAVAGRHIPYHAVALRVVEHNKGSATVIGRGVTLPAMDAAFVNSIMAHSIAMDDMLFMFHPGAVAVPAVLAVSEEEGGRSGAEVITAIVAAYDVMGRVYTGAPQIVPRFRGVPVFGPFGAAAAAGKLLRLDERQMANALSYAANLSCGLSECWVAGTMEARIQAGIATRNGILASQLAREGATAAEKSLEGEAGFYHAFAGTAPDVDLITADLGKKFLIMDARCKTYPVCGLEQAPLELALALARRHALDARDIASIVETIPDEALYYPGTNHPGPFTSRSQATMSAQFCAAAAFSDKPVMSYSFYDTGYDDPKIAALAKKVKLMGGGAPGSVMIEVLLHDGRRYSIEGSEGAVPEPLFEDARAKFDSLTSDFLDKEKTRCLVDVVRDLDKTEDVRILARQLRGATPTGPRDEGEGGP